MPNELTLMLHPTFGVLAMFAAVWVFVDVLNASPRNARRIRTVSVLLAVLLWLSYLSGGYWYVLFYPADKALIQAGPWPFAHRFFMETKEHLFFSLLLLGTYLPIAAADHGLVAGKSQRHLVLTLCALVVMLGLAMEGSGATVGLGVKLALLAR